MQLLDKEIITMEAKITDVCLEALDIIDLIENTQQENIHNATKIIVKSILSGGILQGFGSGYYLSGARELCHRVGGLMPTKIIYDPNYGRLDSVVGVGTELMKKVDVQPCDVLVITSHHGTSPIIVEVAKAAQDNGAKIIAVTSLEVSKKMKPAHPSKTKLYELVDVVIDTCYPYNEDGFNKEGDDKKVVGLSFYATIVILQTLALNVIEELGKHNMGSLIIGASGSQLDPKTNPENHAKYKEYKVRTQRY